MARDRGKANLLAGIESMRAVRMSLVAQVATAYFELVALDNEYAIVKRTLEARSESVRIARLRFEGGLYERDGVPSGRGGVCAHRNLYTAA